MVYLTFLPSFYKLISLSVSLYTLLREYGSALLAFSGEGSAGIPLLSINLDFNNFDIFIGLPDPGNSAATLKVAGCACQVRVTFAGVQIRWGILGGAG